MSELLAKKVQEADRLVRRGEMESARATYVALLGYATGEAAEAIRARIASVDELMGPAARGPVPPPSSVSGPTVQQQAEMAFNEGRVDDAIEIYAHIIEQHPDDTLAKERMTELLAVKNNPLRTRASGNSGPRMVSIQDTMNATAAGEQESGPLGRALEGAHSKAPAEPRASKAAAPVDDAEVELDGVPAVALGALQGNSLVGPSESMDNVLPGEPPSAASPVSTHAAGGPHARPAGMPPAMGQASTHQVHTMPQPPALPPGAQVPRTTSGAHPVVRPPVPPAPGGVVNPAAPRTTSGLQPAVRAPVPPAPGGAPVNPAAPRTTSGLQPAVRAPVPPAPGSAPVNPAAPRTTSGLQSAVRAPVQPAAAHPTAPPSTSGRFPAVGAPTPSTSGRFPAVAAPATHAPSPAPAMRAPPPAPAPVAVSSSPPWPPRGLPGDPVALLKELLSRVHANRRQPSQFTPLAG